MKTKNSIIILAVACLVLLVGTGQALGTVVTDSSDFPPTGKTVGYGPGGVDFQVDSFFDVFFYNFTMVVQTTDPATGDEVATFDTEMVALSLSGSPVVLTGPITTIVRGKGGNRTGSFDTEMVALSLSGNMGGIPIEIRESPNLPSPGELTITDLGGGLFQIDSFFDVFVELSIDGGPFMPQTSGAMRMDLIPNAPEPATMVMLGLGGLAMLRKKRKA